MTKEFIDYRIMPAETQIVKAIAIMAMLIHHLFLEHPEYGGAIYGLAKAGKVCVALFVFLSGYGMATTFPKQSNSRINSIKTFFFFLGKRYIKFYLNYWFVFFITVPIGVFLFGRTLEVAYGTDTNLIISFIRDLFGLQGFDSYNITWWFNELIISLWLFFPLFYHLMKNRIISICVLTFLFINPLGILHYLEAFSFCLSIYVLPFCMGIFFARHSNSINRLLNRLRPQCVLWGSILLTAFLGVLRGYPLVSWFCYSRVDPFITMFLVLAVVSVCRATRFKLSFLRYVGGHSMNMYLTHTFILGYFGGHLIYAIKTPILMFLAVFASSLLLSVVFETIKNKTGFYQLQNKIIKVISSQISSSRN